MHVLVTGANGHLGSNLVPALLAAGHRVRAGVRSVDNAEKTAGLRRLGVELAETDLSRPERLRSAMEGIDVLCHAAAVYSYFEPGREQEIMDVSVRGVEAALRAAAAARVRKVVLTSSAVTVPLTARGAPPSTEEDWASDLRVPYIRAKVEAERLAWKLAGELGLPLVTVLPGSIGGPGFARNTPSIDTIEALMLNAFRMGANPDLISTLRGRRWNASNQRAREILGWRPRIALEQSLRETMTEIRRHRAEFAAKPKLLRPT